MTVPLVPEKYQGDEVLEAGLFGWICCHCCRVNHPRNLLCGWCMADARTLAKGEQVTVGGRPCIGHDEFMRLASEFKRDLEQEQGLEP